MEKLQRSMATYVKSISKREDVETGTKQLPMGYLGTSMISHGDDFREDSEYGQCLIRFGVAGQRIAAEQERLVARSTETWMESIGRSLAQMREYQVCLHESALTCFASKKGELTCAPECSEKTRPAAIGIRRVHDEGPEGETG